MITLPLDWRPAPLHGLLQGRPLLRSEHVLLRVPVGNLRHAFDAIGRLLELPRGPSAQDVSDRLLRRETRRDTLVGHGIALPHAQVPRLRAPVAVYLRPLQPIALSDSSGPLVHDILALLVPKPAAVPHFELLERLSQLLRDPTLSAELARCHTPCDVCQLFAMHGE